VTEGDGGNREAARRQSKEDGRGSRRSSRG